MDITLIAAIGTTVAAGWSAVALGVGVVIGRGIRMAERAEHPERDARLQPID
ncbi:hypothetical protein OG579_13090 [Williamsia herbipolensis]|uniref:Uncharacterized protein n=1 Tax=Williamsia herbipolensis TaxID=1603258 RepID=A0AAU4JY04_9NOCA|nr:hypothetical protein [Williamsia herbipolensis]